jgi:hypothetical protein
MEQAKSEQRHTFSKMMGPPGTVKCLDLVGGLWVGGKNLKNV